MAKSTYQNQVYNAKVELRELITDPTSLLHLTFLTLETSSLKEKILGFTAFPIFIEAETRKPIFNDDP